MNELFSTEKFYVFFYKFAEMISFFFTDFLSKTYIAASATVNVQKQK